MTIHIGFDPGATGAIAAVQYGQLLGVDDMPYLAGEVVAPLLRNIIQGWANRDDRYRPAAWVEKVASRPGQGVASMFRFGQGYGTILGALGAMDIPTERVTPQQWKKAIGVTKDKGSSRRKACELWPNFADQFARVKDDGRAEAALIALCGWNTTGQPS